MRLFEGRKSYGLVHCSVLLFSAKIAVKTSCTHNAKAEGKNKNFMVAPAKLSHRKKKAKKRKILAAAKQG